MAQARPASARVDVLPLKSNVYGANGAELTSPGSINILAFMVSGPAGCDAGATGAAVPIVTTCGTTGGTALRDDTAAGQFVQNWKTPKTIGCYYVRVTGEGLLLSARFRVTK